MSKSTNKKINFDSMNSGVIDDLRTSKQVRLELAQKANDFALARKPLQDKLDVAISTGDVELSKSLSSEIEDLTKAYKAEVTPINKELNVRRLIVEELNRVLGLVPQGMYDCYLKKINEGKRGEYLQACQEFVRRFGAKGTDTAINKMAERLCDLVGIKASSNKMILEKNQFTSLYSKRQFNKMWMSAFCDYALAEIDKSIKTDTEKKQEVA